MSEAKANVDIVVPKSGLGDTDSEVSQWKKAVGDAVSEGEVVVEIETDKSLLEIESEASGVLVEILADEGSAIEPGQVVGRIESH